MFDTALVESGPNRRVRSEGAGLPLAIAAHLVLIGAFVGASAWTVGDPAEPETRIAVFPVFPTLPAPPSAGGGNPAPAPPRLPSNALIPPTVLPPDLPPTEQQELQGPGEPSSDATVPGTGPGGPPGPDGGTGVVPGALPGEPGEPGAILRPGGNVTFPVLLARVDPIYPEAARRARLEGMLILEAVITAAGDVQDVHVLKSIHPLLDAAAAQAVRQWRYRPATRNGRAVPVYLTVTVSFDLRG
jgi:protein TonB